MNFNIKAHGIMTTTNYLIEAKELSKEYPSFTLGPASIGLEAGETVAFLGKNGAGKSTLFQLLTGNLDATSGQVFIEGKKLTPDKFELKKNLGYLPQHLHLPRWSTGLEILRYAASLYQLADSEQKIKSAMSYWDCEFYRDKPLAACSHGMQKRVALAIATLHDPIYLILDEPFSGLDLFHIRALENEIKRRQDEGKTTVLSTHIAPYVAKLCQRVFIADQGQITTLDAWPKASQEERVQLIEKEFFLGE